MLGNITILLDTNQFIIHDFFFNKYMVFPHYAFKKKLLKFSLWKNSKVATDFPPLYLYTACKSDAIITSEKLEKAYLSPWESYEDDSSVLEQRQSCYISIH